jgi:hypothetical protein
MRRLLTTLPLLLAAAGCNVLDSGPPAALPATGAHASFPRGGVVDVIRVDALDTLSLRTAELVAPDGTATSASSLQAVPAPVVSDGTTMYKSAWLDQSSAVNGVPAVFNRGPVPAMYSQTQLQLTISTADIPLPDPVAYRRDWAHYRVRLTFAAPAGRSETRDLAAPEPPPPKS